METISKEEKKNFYQRFNQLDKGIVRILSILESDDKLKEKGLVETVRVMEKDLSELLTREKVYKAKGTVWGIVGGAVGTSLYFFGKFMIAKIFL